MNADGILGANGDITSYNLFAYCSNNPVNADDVTGERSRWLTLIPGVNVMYLPGAVAAFVVQSVHYDARESLNTDLPKHPDRARKLGWRNSGDISPKNPYGGDPKAKCHQFSATAGDDDNINVKWVSPDGHREIVYDKNKNVVTDPRDIGTYNFVPSGGVGGTIGHALLDVIPWIVFGNNDEDTTWIYERLFSLI